MAILKEARAKKVDGYRGKQAKTGNSLGLRFDNALFQSHPEFSGEVLAKSQRREGDPVMEAFLRFLAEDMARSPQQIRPLDQVLTKRIDALVGHLPVNPHEDLGDEPLV